MKKNRFATEAKKTKPEPKGPSNVILLSAGEGKRMRSMGNRSLIELKDGNTILDYQLAAIRQQYPNAHVTIVIGFEAHKFYKIPGLHLIENENFNETNVPRGIGLAVNALGCGGALCIYGDLIFNGAAIAKITGDESVVIVDNSEQIRESEIGVSVDGPYASFFAYGLKMKWAQMAYFTGNEFRLLKKLCNHCDNFKLCGFEILNRIIEMGGKFKIVENADSKLIEVDNIKDLTGYI